MSNEKIKFKDILSNVAKLSDDEFKELHDLMYKIGIKKRGFEAYWDE
jgi:hypothetical protein